MVISWLFTTVFRLLAARTPTQANLQTNVGSGFTSARSLYQPLDAAANSNRLAVVDGENRVLLYPNIPATGPTDASVVLGQTSMILSGSGCTSRELNTPYSVSMTDDKVVVADYGNNRILLWNAWEVSNGQAADVVFGQADFTSGAANAGRSVSASTLSGPRGCSFVKNKLLASDSANNRVLIYESQ